MKKIHLIITGLLLFGLIWSISPFGYFDLFNKRKISLDSEVVKELDANISDAFDRKKVIRPIINTTLIVFKKEQKAVIWVTDNVAQNHFMLSDSIQINPRNGTRLYDDEDLIPEGVYEIESVNSDDLSFQIDYPNAFDIQKQVADKRPKMTTKVIFETTNGDLKLSKNLMTEFLFLAKESGIENSNIIIVPNDFRNEKNIPYCATCPHWIEELYGSLRLYLSDYPLELQ